MEQLRDGQLNIELSAEVAEGTAIQISQLSHSISREFVVDFIRIMPEHLKANVKSRIILTPEHCAKRLLFCFAGKNICP